MIVGPVLSAESLTSIEELGFVVVGRVLDHGAVCCLVSELGQAALSASVSQRAEVYAIRHLLDTVPAIRDLAGCERLRDLVEPVLGATVFPVQGTYFDKSPEVNWKVPWHQDLTIPVQARGEATGFGPWSVKGGVPHVQAPAWLLERTLVVRLHLDDCTAENGALRVIAGSHRHGRLAPVEIDRLREQCEAVTCEVPRGGALVMRPLLLHASSAAHVPGHRRVIHLEYAADPLPAGLEWYYGRPSFLEGA
jgi:hypothetical protein